jgi:hypothetical protein
MSKDSKQDMFEVLRALLHDVLRARFDGAPYAKLMRAHGYADGYMRGLLDSGMADRAELIALVGDVRRKYVEEETSPATIVAA